MDLRQLRYFVMVAEELSFSRAALRLHMSQPPLSHQIKALEEELGVELLFRNRREVKLTDAGRVFLREARSLLEQAQAAVNRAKQSASGEVGVLRLGMSTSAVFHVMPDFIARLTKRFPKLQVSVTDMGSDDQVRALAMDKLDIGFIHARLDNKGLSHHTMLTEPFSIVLPEHHPLASKPDLSLTDLEDLPMVAFSREQRSALFDALVAACQHVGFSPRISHVARHPHSLMQIVRSGLGVSILPRSYANEEQLGLHFRHLPHTAGQVKIDAIWRDGNPSELVQKVVHEILLGQVVTPTL